MDNSKWIEINVENPIIVLYFKDTVLPISSHILLP